MLTIGLRLLVLVGKGSSTPLSFSLGEFRLRSGSLSDSASKAGFSQTGHEHRRALHAYLVWFRNSHWSHGNEHDRPVPRGTGLSGKQTSASVGYVGARLRSETWIVVNPTVRTLNPFTYFVFDLEKPRTRHVDRHDLCESLRDRHIMNEYHS